MKYTLKITDEKGQEQSFDLVLSSGDEPKNLNDFILNALTISEDQRRKPFYICPKGGYQLHYIKLPDHASKMRGNKPNMIEWRITLQYAKTNQEEISTLYTECPKCGWEPMIKVNEKYICEMCGHSKKIITIK